MICLDKIRLSRRSMTVECDMNCRNGISKLSEVRSPVMGRKNDRISIKYILRYF
jgi:hypothetical protein